MIAIVSGGATAGAVVLEVAMDGDKVVSLSGSSYERSMQARRIDLEKYCRDTHGNDITGLQGSTQAR